MGLLSIVKLYVYYTNKNFIDTSDSLCENVLRKNIDVNIK